MFKTTNVEVMLRRCAVLFAFGVYLAGAGLLHGIEIKGWIRNDVNAGFVQARLTGKPLLVTFRCEP